MRDKLKQTKNRLNLFQNGLKQIEKIQTKKKTEWRKANRKNAESFGSQKRQNLLQNRSKGITKMQNVLQNEIKQIKKLINLLQGGRMILHDRRKQF